MSGEALEPAPEVTAALSAHGVVDVGLRFAGLRFPPEMIVVAIRWYLHFNLSYRDIEELLLERGIEVDHVTVFRWVQRFTPLLTDAARFCRHSSGDMWFVDETYVKIVARWRAAAARA